MANNERVMRAVVEAASIRGIRPFEGIECDPPTLEENAEACGDAMSARIRELEANPPKPHHNGLMQISNELVQARQRIAELEKGHQEAAKQINSWRRLAKQNIAERGKDISELEAARQRIAELEARTVNLSKLSVGEVMHLSGFSRDYAEGWCAGNDNAIHEIRAAGIKVKGE
ncbi:ead/Ea22-like family protein [Salmonella enterica]|nr:ead/Ea22-like family protein [Salmonella enterica]EJM7680176.1 ead/Ea22-like family protein [Salmonella enterica]